MQNQVTPSLISDSLSLPLGSPTAQMTNNLMSAANSHQELEATNSLVSEFGSSPSSIGA